jgi:hypothetical protein
MAYTNIDDPSAYFQTALWTGNGTAGNAVTFDGNSDMQPDFVWSKIRSAAFGHVLKDTSRGGTANNDQHLVSNSDAAESTYSQYRMDFDSDGFTLDGVGDSGFQGSGTSMVSWAWKANGGTTSSNTDGSITSTVQANTDAGFSIVTYTGSGSDGSTVGHGLGAVPAMVIFKCRSDSNTDWRVYHQSISPTNALSINSTSAQYGASSVFTSAFSSTQLKLENEAGANGSSKTYVAYCFAEKKGYSKFGVYTSSNLGDVANGRVRGKYVHTGFKPAFVMLKCISTSTNWMMFNHKRPTYGNEIDLKLGANNTAAENGSDLGNTSQNNLDFYANGFRCTSRNTDTNTGTNVYVYMAFAENPFVTSTGIPTTAR